MTTKLKPLWTIVSFLAVYSLFSALGLSRVWGVVSRHDKDNATTLKLGAEFKHVGRVIPNGCCTLIAPKWAISAAHVAASIKPGDQLEFEGSKYGVRRTIIHPEGTAPKGIPPEVDLALIELSEPVSTVTPAEIYRGRQELGQFVYIVGYGDYGSPLSKLQATDGLRRGVTNIIDDAGPRRIFMTFEEPPKGTESEGVGGPGDSGGPAFIKVKDQCYLAGVSSASMNGKPGSYGVTDVYVRLSSYVYWIDDIVKNTK